MVALVSTLKNIVIRDQALIVVLTRREIEDGVSAACGERDRDEDLVRALDREFEKFGTERRVWALRATRQASKGIYEEVCAKPWNPELKKLMQETESPFLLFLEDEFEGFDPGSSNWRILWLESIKSPRETVKSFFDSVKASIKRGEPVFDFFDRLTEGGPITRYGAVSSPKSTVPKIDRRRQGRPGVMDPEYGVEEWIHQRIALGGFKPTERGWKTKLVKDLMADKPALARTYSEKSIRDAIRSCSSEHPSGLFKFIEDAVFGTS